MFFLWQTGSKQKCILYLVCVMYIRAEPEAGKLMGLLETSNLMVDLGVQVFVAKCMWNIIVRIWVIQVIRYRP